MKFRIFKDSNRFKRDESIAKETTRENKRRIRRRGICEKVDLNLTRLCNRLSVMVNDYFPFLYVSCSCSCNRVFLSKQKCNCNRSRHIF